MADELPPTPHAAPARSAAVFTPAQLLADNLATRARELAAISAFTLMAKWALVSGTLALSAILVMVLPIELTRQVMRGSAAKVAAGGAATAAKTVPTALLVGALALKGNDAVSWLAITGGILGFVAQGGVF